MPVLFVPLTNPQQRTVVKDSTCVDHNSMALEKANKWFTERVTNGLP